MTPKIISSVDIEGNGRIPPDIVEIAITPIENYEIKNSFSWLVKPSDSITAMATRIHGLRTDDVSGMPKFDEIKGKILELLDGSYLLAHNVSVERKMLSRKLSEWKPEGYIDTLRLSRILLPEIGSHSLTSLVKCLNLDIAIAGKVETGPHRAKYDSLATAYLFCELSKLAKFKNINIESFISNDDDLEDRQLSLF